MSSQNMVTASISRQPHQLTEVDITREIDVEQISEFQYRGIKPLKKPSQTRRGVYGGALCAQAVLVAIRSSPAKFKPHSIHTFFVKKVDESSVIDWKVEKLLDGKTFANRSIQGLQNNEVVFTANISLTTKNSTKPNKDGSMPFGFQTTPQPELKNYDSSKLKPYDNTNLHLSVRFFPEYTTSDVYTYLSKYGVDGEEYIAPIPSEYKYVAFTWITDWMNLETLLGNMGHPVDPLFNVSLDHSVYFHDDDFDATKWIGMCLRTTRLNHNRAMLFCDLYNDKGVQVATVVQERLFIGDYKPKL